MFWSDMETRRGFVPNGNPGVLEEGLPLQPARAHDQIDADLSIYDFQTPQEISTQTYAEAQYPEVFAQQNDGMAEWILPDDRIPIKLAISLYTKPIYAFGGYKIFAVQPRSAAWYNCSTQVVILGLRGTSALDEGGSSDLQDDMAIGFGSACDLSLVNEATGLVDELQSQEIVKGIVFAGHSLGGTAAFCLANKYPDTRAVAFNMGAPATNPVTTGPGPDRAIHYHIVGDFISSHVSPEAAKIVRISFSDTDFFSTYWTHQAARALATDITWKYSDADYEDDLWQTFGFVYGLTPFQSRTELSSTMRGLKPPEEYPIPGSSRSLAPGAPSMDPSLSNTLQGAYHLVEDVADFLLPELKVYRLFKNFGRVRKVFNAIGKWGRKLERSARITRRILRQNRRRRLGRIGRVEHEQYAQMVSMEDAAWGMQ